MVVFVVDSLSDAAGGKARNALLNHAWGRCLAFQGRRGVPRYLPHCNRTPLKTPRKLRSLGEVLIPTSRLGRGPKAVSFAGLFTKARCCLATACRKLDDRGINVTYSAKGILQSSLYVDHGFFASNYLDRSAPMGAERQKWPGQLSNHISVSPTRPSHSPGVMTPSNR